MSNIQWTNQTWNPWQGCIKISPGCKNCYMYRDKAQYGQDGSNIYRSAPATFNKPLHIIEPSKIFTCSWSDFFIEEADPWREAAWDIIRHTQHLTYQILTKHPERIPECLPWDWAQGYQNVWLGVSVEDNETCVERFSILNQIPAIVKFISFEPLLERIKYIPQTFDWAIIGGESGNDTGRHRYRETKLKWIEELISEMNMAKIPVFVKQLGTYLAKQLNLKNRKGGNMEEWPSHLRIREFPRDGAAPAKPEWD